MRDRSHRPTGHGFTLIELIIIVAIIGIIVAILIPNLLDSLQKAKQKRTMADMKLAGTSWMSWLTDQVSAAAAGDSQTTVSWSSMTSLSYQDVRNMLVPQYTAEVPRTDAWRQEFEFADSGLFAHIPMAIRSRGSDGIWDSDDYSSGPFISTDYAHDLVWAGGYFIQWPDGLRGVED